MEEAAVEPKRGPGRPPNRPKTSSLDEEMKEIESALASTKYTASAPPAPSEPEKPKGPSVVALHMSRIKLAEGARQVHSVDVPAGTAPDMLTNPLYWRHVMHTLTAGDQIEARWEDGTRELWLRVLYLSPVGAKVSRILEVEHEAIGEEETDNFAVVFKGMGQKWCVVRTDTKTVLKDHFPARSEAMAFLAQHLRDMRR